MIRPVNLRISSQAHLRLSLKESGKHEVHGFGYNAGGIVAGTMPGSQKESPAVFGCHLAAKDLVQPVNKPVAPYFFKNIYKKYNIKIKKIQNIFL